MGLVIDWLLDPLGLLLVWTLLLAGVNAGLGAGLGAASVGGRWRGPVLLACWWAGLAAMSAPALVNPLVASHERRIEPGACLAGSPIVVLGGGIDTRSTDATRFEAMSPATLSRVAEAARLSLADPSASVIVSGGAGRPPASVSEARVMAHLLRRLGVADAAIVLETVSVSTATNVRELQGRGLLGDADAPRLVTSALHMPRAMATFEAAGLIPCPVPVGRLAVDAPWWTLWPQSSAMIKFDRWLHEQLALVLYRLRGDVRAWR